MELNDANNITCRQVKSMYRYDQSAYNRGPNSYGYNGSGYREYAGEYQHPGYQASNYGPGFQSRAQVPPSPGHKILNAAFGNYQNVKHYGLASACFVVLVAHFVHNFYCPH